MKSKIFMLVLICATLGMAICYSLKNSPSHETDHFKNPSTESTRKSSFTTELPPSRSQISDAVEPKKEAENAVSRPASTSQAGNSKSHFLRLIEPILQNRLISEGFSANEIDVTLEELTIEFEKSQDSVKYSEAAYSAAKKLGFSEERKDQLNIAVLKSIADSVEITFEQWDKCLKYRTKSTSQCVQAVAQELSRSVAAAISSQSLLGEGRLKAVDLANRAATQAVEQCNISQEEAEKAMRIVLSDCP